jgi:hypothetical protein
MLEFRTWAISHTQPNERKNMFLKMLIASTSIVLVVGLIVNDSLLEYLMKEVTILEISSLVTKCNDGTSQGKCLKTERKKSRGQAL